tara:strand:+ start:123 stop:269 length:147 start_codon:yes stop_codon:yes gene_type:complete
MNKNKKIFLIWLSLVVLWNFGVPGALPVYDVLAAAVLFFLSALLRKIL